MRKTTSQADLEEEASKKAINVKMPSKKLNTFQKSTTFVI